MRADYHLLDLSDKKLLLKNIPEDMKRYHNWCVYKLLYDRKSGRTTKKPINPKSFKGASSTDPDTWVSYDEAEKCFLERKADGLGFMFGYTPFVGVDIDHCVKSGGMSEEASDIIKRLDSYTEYSPSRTGVHIICKAHEGFKLNGSKNTKKGIEIYSEARFFTMTGDMLPGYGCLRECEGALTGVHAEYIKGNTSPDKGEEATAINSDNETAPLDDTELLEKMFACKKGKAIKALFYGNYNTNEFKSQSEADLSLCSYLAFWTNKDGKQMDRIFRRSALMRPKWDELRGSETYGAITVKKAMDGCAEGYGAGKKDGFTRSRNGKIILEDIALEDIAKHLVRAYNIINIEDTLHYYDNGLYKPITGGVFDRIALSELHNSKSNYRKELLPYVKAEAKNRELSPPNFILFNNGVLDIAAGELKAFSKSYTFLNRIPHNYNPNAAKCGELDGFINSFVNGDEEAAVLLWEVIGYCFFRGNPLQEFILIQGNGGNGKSTFLEFLTFIVGKENTSFLTLDDLMNKYLLNSLHNRLLNVGDDINSVYKEQEDTLKKLVSGETITADIKYKEPVNIKFYGKMIFSANTVPRFSDKSNGLKRRINILPFTNDFTKNGKRDFNILAELRSEAVAEYCIYKAVTHLKKLLSTGSFTKTKAVINANKEYAKRNNPVLEFLEDLENGDIKNDVDITAGTDITAVPANKVFEYYKNWCFHSNYKAVGRNEFYRLVQLEGYEKKRGRKEGEREYYFYPLQ